MQLLHEWYMSGGFEQFIYSKFVGVPFVIWSIIGGIGWMSIQGNHMWTWKARIFNNFIGGPIVWALSLIAIPIYIGFWVAPEYLNKLNHPEQYR